MYDLSYNSLYTTASVSPLVRFIIQLALHNCLCEPTCTIYHTIRSTQPPLRAHLYDLSYNSLCTTAPASPLVRFIIQFALHNRPCEPICTIYHTNRSAQPPLPIYSFTSMQIIMTLPSGSFTVKNAISPCRSISVNTGTPFDAKYAFAPSTSFATNINSV